MELKENLLSNILDYLRRYQTAVPEVYASSTTMFDVIAIPRHKDQMAIPDRKCKNMAIRRFFKHHDTDSLRRAIHEIVTLARSYPLEYRYYMAVNPRDAIRAAAFLNEHLCLTMGDYVRSMGSASVSDSFRKLLLSGGLSALSDPACRASKLMLMDLDIPHTDPGVEKLTGMAVASGAVEVHRVITKSGHLGIVYKPFNYNKLYEGLSDNERAACDIQTDAKLYIGSESC